mmetsp:Transcript_1711/g.6026  ORF Transcript_1711/g.6026 Transcript_1711/m.6026 type:complete len:95 (+) Transcript_1711:290-574(+)
MRRQPQQQRQAPGRDAARNSLQVPQRREVPDLLTWTALNCCGESGPDWFATPPLRGLLVSPGVWLSARPCKRSSDRCKELVLLQFHVGSKLMEA